MPNDTTITAGQVELKAELNHSAPARAVREAFPISSMGNTWGDEIYFRTPVTAESQDLKELVGFGALAFWPLGNTSFIFFGPTPASRGDEIRAANGVAIIGKIVDDGAQFRQVSSGKQVSSGMKVTIPRA